MSQTTIRKRYRRQVLGAGAGYIGAVFGVSTQLSDTDPVTVLTVGLAFLPGLFILLMVYAMWVYIRDVDEAARHFMVNAMMSALFVTLAISGVWGLAELFLDGLPRLPVFFVFPIVMGMFGAFTAFGPARGMGCA
jgi:phage shock protein PspC (stress-responsive transcriptional regulator)